MKTFILISLFILSLTVHAQTNDTNSASFLHEHVARQQVIGTVAKTDGNTATVINVNSKEAQKVHKGQKVLNDSSFWCPDNCYINIRFNNKLTYLKIGQQTSVQIRVENKKLIVKLHSGFIKTLFKSSDTLDLMEVATPNSVSLVENAKSLFIYNNLFRKTSVLNYKGEVDLKALKPGPEVVQKLEKNTYSYIEDKDSTPAEPQFLTPHQLNKLLSAFDIDTKKLD